MTRIRTIKPEMWVDEKLSVLEPIHRLVFPALISMADDYGRLVDSVKQVDAFLFSRTNDSAAVSLNLLHFLGLIERGQTASGQDVIQIVNWEKHQKVNHPNERAALPAIATLIPRPASAPQERRKNAARKPLAGLLPLISTSTSTNDQYQRPEPSQGSGLVGKIPTGPNPITAADVLGRNRWLADHAAWRESQATPPAEPAT